MHSKYECTQTFTDQLETHTDTVVSLMNKCTTQTLKNMRAVVMETWYFHNTFQNGLQVLHMLRNSHYIKLFQHTTGCKQQPSEL